MGCTIEPLLDNQVCKYIHSSCINAKVQDLSNILDKNKETYSTISFFSPDSKTNISIVRLQLISRSYMSNNVLLI